MRNWRHRYLRYEYTGIGLLFLLILYIYLRTSQSNDYDGSDASQLEYCDQAVIQQYFMNNQRPAQLFKKAPIRSNFTYQINNENFCTTSIPHAIIFIVSKSSNFESRNAIRRTWGNFLFLNGIKEYSHLRLHRLFLIDIDETRLLSTQLEQNIYQDIVQVHLPQQYILSTYRDMAILHWTETYCPQTKYTIKTDDDIFVNIYLLANIINTLLANVTMDEIKNECSHLNPSGVIYGIEIPQAKVVRHSRDPILEGGRYIMTRDEYPCRYYPNYMSGFGYIINAHARINLLCTFFRHKNPLQLSDVYVTGLLPEYLNIRRRHLGLIISYRSSDDCEVFFRQNDPDTYACASSLHYNDKHVNVFERFHTYSRRIYENRYLYIERTFSRLLLS